MILMGLDLSIKRKSGVCIVDKDGNFLNFKFNLGETLEFGEIIKILKFNEKINLIVIDAPLTYPEKNFRDAEIELSKEGIRTLPLVLLRGMRNFVEKIKDVYTGEIIETFPEGVFKSLNLKGGRKFKRDRKILFNELKKFISFPDGFSSTDKDFLDASLCAICGLFYLRGRVRKFGGMEGIIYLPINNMI